MDGDTGCEPLGCNQVLIGFWPPPKTGRQILAMIASPIFWPPARPRWLNGLTETTAEFAQQAELRPV